MGSADFLSPSNQRLFKTTRILNIFLLLKQKAADENLSRAGCLLVKPYAKSIKLVETIK
jgi:hypothetical protein